MRKLINNVKFNLISLLRPNGKIDFIKKISGRKHILDVGCGNDSIFHTKFLQPKSIYTGIDVGDYNQTKPEIADNYIITSPDMFSATIKEFENEFDIVISSHNLEHCDDREGTLKAMLGAIKEGGTIFLAFPCENSINYPKRKGTLNYYDDLTHKGLPPNFDDVISTIKSSGFSIKYSSRNYQPILLRLIGLIIEPVSNLTRKVYHGTWECWGFESIIIAQYNPSLFSHKNIMEKN